MTAKKVINAENAIKAQEKPHVQNEEHNSSHIKASIINAKHIGTDYSYKHEIVWKNAIGFLILHIMAIWGFVLLLNGNIKLLTFLTAFFFAFFSTEGVTIGAHRLFAHKTFTASPLLKAVLIIFQTIAGQNSVFIWCRDHRLHHRYSDTDGDPHNSKRGFFFCHMGWLMSKKHPYVIELGRNIDMSDLQADWMVMAQKKYYYYLYFTFAVFIPAWIPVYYFGESWWNSLLFCYFTRYIIQLNGTWLVNSAAHLYGTRPYDKNLQPVESWFISFISLGEGWHNYHHAFPWDYKAAELSMHFNQSATFIRFFEKIGLASDLKTASPEMVTNRIIRTGDGTHYKLGYDEAKISVTAVGPLHPLNPSYTTKYEAPSATLKQEGLPLFHENDVFDVQTTVCLINKAKCSSLIHDNASLDKVQKIHYLKESKESNISSLRLWQMSQRMVQNFWRRWSEEYLVHCMQRYKWSQQTPEPEIGSVVLIKEADLPPARWLMGKIEQKHPGLDYIVCVVTTKCKDSLIKRPTSKLFVLSITE